MGDLQGFMKRMIRRNYSIDSFVLAINGEIAMQLDHCPSGCDRFGAIDLNLIIILSWRDER